MAPKDLFDLEQDHIPTLDDVAAGDKLTPELPPLDEDIARHLSADLPAFGHDMEGQSLTEKNIQAAMDLERLEEIIEPIVKRKIAQFATELSRVVVKEVMDAIEDELKR